MTCVCILLIMMHYLRVKIEFHSDCCGLFTSLRIRLMTEYGDCATMPRDWKIAEPQNEFRHVLNFSCKHYWQIISYVCFHKYFMLCFGLTINLLHYITISTTYSIIFSLIKYYFCSKFRYLYGSVALYYERMIVNVILVIILILISIMFRHHRPTLLGELLNYHQLHPHLW